MCANDNSWDAWFLDFGTVDTVWRPVDGEKEKSFEMVRTPTEPAVLPSRRGVVIYMRVLLLLISSGLRRSSKSSSSECQ